MIDILLQKLRILGIGILVYNDFGIIYKDKSGFLHLLKLTASNGNITKQDITGFKQFRVAKHFIEITGQYGVNPYKLYIKSSDKNILNRFKQMTIASGNERGSTLGKLSGDYEVIGGISYSGGIYAINYLGKIINLSKYTINSNQFKFSVLKEGNKYIIGYSHSNYWDIPLDDEYECIMTHIDKPIIITDKNFNNIEYKTSN